MVSRTHFRFAVPTRAQEQIGRFQHFREMDFLRFCNLFSTQFGRSCVTYTTHFPRPTFPSKGERNFAISVARM